MHQANGGQEHSQRGVSTTKRAQRACPGHLAQDAIGMPHCPGFPPLRPDADIEDITHKTGNHKRFPVFVEMLLSAISQRSDSVYVDLLTYSDLVS